MHRDADPDHVQKAIVDNRLAVTVDCVIFGYGEDGLKILLLECNLPHFAGHWSLLGDFVSAEEDMNRAAYRVLEHYTGLRDIFLEQVSTFGKTGRHPLGRVITTAYYALMQLEDYENNRDHGGLAVKWFSIDALPLLAFDHADILHSCLQRLRRGLRERPIGFKLLPKMFTLSQLQTLYEVVLGIGLDKRNFRRKLRGLGVLMDTGQAQQEVSHRPAKLYRFDDTTYKRQVSSGFKFEI